MRVVKVIKNFFLEFFVPSDRIPEKFIVKKNYK